MTWRIAIYGLHVELDRPPALPASEASRPWRGEADVVITHSADEVAAHGAAGDDLLLVYPPSGAPRYFSERRADGSHLLVFVGACEFEVSADLRDVVVRRHRGAVSGIEDVLTMGGFLAWQLYVRGELVLHASAVELDGAAIAFTGHPGMGKSTMATLMCAAGAAMLSDDVVRVDGVGGADARPVARRGSPELRLRKGADTLAGSFQGAAPARRASADDRQVLRPAEQAADDVPLRALFIPRPSRELTEVRVERIAPVEAAFVLLGFPRLYGWRDERVRAAQFALLSRVVASVPLSVVHVPWGPPFAPEIAARVREAALSLPADVKREARVVA